MQRLLKRFGGLLTYDLITSYVAQNPTPPSTNVINTWS